METIGGYEVLDELGRGGMGVVYRARDPRSGRAVALKLLLALSDPEERARFQREAETTRDLEHPHVLRVLELGQDRGRPFLVTELAEGGSLAQRLREQPLAPAEAARVVAEIAQGLAAAHRSGALHRDLKPANVLFARDGRALLADFGLARRLRDETLTATGTVLGTPGYMSPEQARGERVDERSDVYGLGSLLYAALSGGPPFRGTSPLATLSAVVNDPVPTLGAEVPGSLAAICTRCLAKDPAQRYPDAGAVAAALSAWRPGARFAGPLWLGVVALLFLLLGALWGARGERSALAPSPGASAPRQESPHELAIARAEGHLDRHENELARRLIAALHSQTPADPAVLELGARLAMVERDFVRAKELITQALERGPETGRRLALFANATANLGDRERGDALLERALALDPTNPEVLASRGFAYLSSDAEAALHYGELACEHGPTLALARVLCSFACERLGRLEEAAEWAEQGARIDPRNPDVRYRLGLVLAQQDKLPAALKEFERVIALDGAHLGALVCAARACAKVGRAEEGREHLERLLTQLERSRSAQRGSEPSPSELSNWFRILVKYYPKNLESRYEFAKALFATGEFGPARIAHVRLWQRNGEQFYRDSALRWAEANLEFVRTTSLDPDTREQLLAQAEELANQALARDRGDLSALRARGRAALGREPERAYRDLRLVLDQGYSAEAALDCAQACLQLQRYPQARRLLERVAREEPRSSEARLLLAEALLGGGEGLERAERLSREVLAERPRAPAAQRAQRLLERIAAARATAAPTPGPR